VYGPRPVQTAGGHWFTLFTRMVYQPTRTPKVRSRLLGENPGVCRIFREIACLSSVMVPQLRRVKCAGVVAA
jgi:hypothetical protein